MSVVVVECTCALFDKSTTLIRNVYSSGTSPLYALKDHSWDNTVSIGKVHSRIESDRQSNSFGLVNITSLEPFAEALFNGIIENKKTVSNSIDLDFTSLPDYSTV